MPRVTGVAAGVLVSVAALTAAQAPQQVFRSAVDLVRVDVQVIGRDGHPMIGLGLDDFEVGINGSDRRVVSAELVKFTPAEDIVNALRPVRTPGHIPPDSRVYVIAVDLAAFDTGSMMPLRESVRRFLGQLRPQDLVALYTFPYSTTALDLTHDHSVIGRALDRLIGIKENRLGAFNLSPSEIVDITANDADALRRAVQRECFGADIVDPVCPKAVEAEASALASFLEADATVRLNALSNLARRLATIQGRKTVVLLSGGLMSATRTSGRPDVTSLLSAVGDETANSQTNLYVLHSDTAWADAAGAAAPRSRRPADRMRTLFADREVAGQGLDLLTGKAGGALYRVEGGGVDHVFDRVLRETTAYYLLGVEPVAADRDGRVHFIRVKVRSPGATVRSRTQVVIPAK